MGLRRDRFARRGFSVREETRRLLEGAEQFSRGPGLMAAPDVHQAPCALGVTRHSGVDAEVAAEGSIFLRDLFGDESFGCSAGLVPMMNKRGSRSCE